MRKIAATAALAVMLGGCVDGALDTQPEVTAATDLLSADLRAAIADADIHNDRAASSCYRAVLDHVEALPARTEGQVIGAVTAFQKARNVRRALDAGVPEDVHIACAAVVDDAKSTATRLLKLLRIAL